MSDHSPKEENCCFQGSHTQKQQTGSLKVASDPGRPQAPIRRARRPVHLKAAVGAASGPVGALPVPPLRPRAHLRGVSPRRLEREASGDSEWPLKCTFVLKTDSPLGLLLTATALGAFRGCTEKTQLAKNLWIWKRWRLAIYQHRREL